eukprot:scaffold689_cov333-Pavlova_lutheri.AAC.13
MDGTAQPVACAAGEHVGEGGGRRSWEGVHGQHEGGRASWWDGKHLGPAAEARSLRERPRGKTTATRPNVRYKG